MISNAGNVPPIIIPPGSPLIPAWAYEAVKRLNMITGATIQAAPAGGGVGSSAFSFSGSNAVFMLPLSSFSGRFIITKATVSGNQGLIVVQNGIVTAFTSPT